MRVINNRYVPPKIPKTLEITCDNCDSTLEITAEDLKFEEGEYDSYNPNSSWIDTLSCMCGACKRSTRIGRKNYHVAKKMYDNKGK